MMIDRMTHRNRNAGCQMNMFFNPDNKNTRDLVNTAKFCYHLRALIIRSGAKGQTSILSIAT